MVLMWEGQGCSWLLQTCLHRNGWNGAQHPSGMTSGVISCLLYCLMCFIRDPQKAKRFITAAASADPLHFNVSGNHPIALNQPESAAGADK